MSNQVDRRGARPTLERALESSTHGVYGAPMPQHAEARVASAAPDAVNGATTRSGGWTLSALDWRSALSAVALMLADWLTVFACLVAGWWVRRGVAPRLVPSLTPVMPLATFIAQLFLLAPWTVAFAEAALYTRRAVFWDEARRVLYA